MQRETKTRLGIAALIYLMTNAVMFGAGLDSRAALKRMARYRTNAVWQMPQRES
jgi:hypothetical protein